MRKWQTSALRAWVTAGNKGIVAAATGSGKTRLALEVISTSDADRVAVVVPTSVLQKQWVRELKSNLGLSKRMLGTLGGFHPVFTLQHTFVVAVINSARKRLAGVIAHWHHEQRRVLLIVDECHWAGSEQSGGLFEHTPAYVLGLSATPERSDEGFEEVMLPNLGEVVYRYPLKSAIGDGTVSEIVSSHMLFRLTSAERRASDSLTAKIVALRGDVAKRHPKLGVGPGWAQRLVGLSEHDAAACQLQRLLDERRAAIAGATGRISCFGELIASGYLKNRRTLVFNETIAQAILVAAQLRELDQEFLLEHSQLPDSQREVALNRFATGAVPILVAVRALDEGLDIPEANVAVIVSGSLNVRKRIQRIGRIARVSTTSAEVISILARGSAEEYETQLLDIDLLGAHRVRRLDLDASQALPTA